MAQFLNNPATKQLESTRWRLLTEPLIFQFAGLPIAQHLVDDFLACEEWELGRKSFLSQLVPDQQVIIVMPGLMTDGPSVPGYVIFFLIGVFASGMGYIHDGGALFDLFWTFLSMGIRTQIAPYKFLLSGFLHDRIRNLWTTGNAATDGMLRDAAFAEGMSAISCYLIYFGVRLGTFINFKSVPPQKVVEAAALEWARINQVSLDRVTYHQDNCYLTIT